MKINGNTRWPWWVTVYDGFEVVWDVWGRRGGGSRPGPGSPGRTRPCWWGGNQFYERILMIFHDFHWFFIDFHDFMRHFLLQNHWYLDRKLWISMKHEHLSQVTAPSSRGLEKLWDIILIRTRGDLANGGGLIRWEWPDARLFSRDIQKYFSFYQSRSM